MDETRPGNVLRPDLARSYLAVYWCFMDLPGWFLASLPGWNFLAFVPLKCLKKMPGGDSQLTRDILRIFWPAGNRHPTLPDPDAAQQHPDFSTPGAFLTCGPTQPGDALGLRNAIWVLVAVFACIVGDEKALTAIAYGKGPQATVPCYCCRNVMGRIKPEDVPAQSGLVHFSSGDFARIVLHTPATMRELYDDCESQRVLVGHGVTQTQYRKQLQSFGINVSPHSLMASDMAELAQLPDSLFWDWMHTLVASSGTAQHELNQLLRRIRQFVPLTALEEFQKLIVFPTREKPAKLSLDDRLKTRNKNDSFFRGFASEVVQWVVVVGLFCEVELGVEAAAALHGELQCFQLLGRIIFLLRLGSECAENVALGATRCSPGAFASRSRSSAASTLCNPTNSTLPRAPPPKAPGRRTSRHSASQPPGSWMHGWPCEPPPPGGQCLLATCSACGVARHSSPALLRCSSVCLHRQALPYGHCS